MTRENDPVSGGSYVTQEDTSALRQLAAARLEREREDKRGIYDKYEVRRTGDTAPKHAACRYFVLDPQHDPHAAVALRAYAASARSGGWIVLARELEEWADGAQQEAQG